jgi:hypothetical protein
MITKHEPFQTTKQDEDSFSFFIRHSQEKDYCLLRNAILNINEKNKMNKELANQVIEDLKQEREGDLQLLAGLRKINTPSSEQTRKEIEQKSQLIETVLKSFGQYIAMAGIQLNGETTRETPSIVPQGRKSDYVREIIQGIPKGEEFDIHRVRDRLRQVHPSIFGTSEKDNKDFYPLYWSVIKELLNKKIKVAKEGKGKRAVVFARIEEKNKP